jgi:hypothetical protein
VSIPARHFKLKKTNDMKKLLALVAVGVAVKYFLDSEQGKQVKKQVMDLLSELQDTFSEGINKAGGKITEVRSQAENR